MLSERVGKLLARLRAVFQDWVMPALRRPAESLPSRIIVSVFAAALVTSLAVTWISTRSIESFLREKIDEKYPDILRTTSERLDLWYSQRELEIETFARSATVVENLGRLTGNKSGRSRARKEVAEYLSYVLEGFPQYEALFVLDSRGQILVRVGPEFQLPDSRLRRLGGMSHSQVGDVERFGERVVQVASAPVKNQRDQKIATLHAFVRTDELSEVLRSDEIGPSGVVYIVGRQGEPLRLTANAVGLGNYERPLPPTGVRPVVEKYARADGADVIGSSVRFGRLGWTIVVEEEYEDAFAPVVAVIREILGINVGIVVVFGLIALQMARSIVRPIQALSDAALRIASGETDVLIPGTTRADELGVLTRTFNEMSLRLRDNQRKLEVQNQELQRMNEIFQQLSITDGLTKLHNHRFFQDQLPREMKRADRTNSRLCLILIDIDDFKKLNDRFGHAAGDHVLRRVAEIMNECIRDTDLLARYGGEEFALLASQTDLEGALYLAERIRRAISRARFSLTDGDRTHKLSITASLGLAPYRGDRKAFFNDADRALYSAKNAGKDCVVVADED